MIEQRNNKLWHRVNAASRLAIVRGYQPFSKYPLINEYPKSGGSWMAQLFAEATGLPFPRNRLPMLKSSIMHGHYRPHNVGSHSFMIWRDGRDVAVSFYFHRVVGNAYTGQKLALATQKALSISDPSDVNKYLPRFIELLAKGGTHPGYSWGQFVQEWRGSDRAFHEIKYEDMLRDSAGELQRACKAAEVDLDPKRAKQIAHKYSFKSQSKRVSGEEDQSSYLRKGVAGDWREKFTKEAAEVFDHFMGDALIDLGYENNRDWVEVVA